MLQFRSYFSSYPVTNEEKVLPITFGIFLDELNDLINKRKISSSRMTSGQCKGRLKMKKEKSIVYKLICGILSVVMISSTCFFETSVEATEVPKNENPRPIYELTQTPELVEVSGNTVSSNDMEPEDSLPGLYAPATRQNVVAVLNYYDADGTYIINKYTAEGGDFMGWWSSSTLFDTIWGIDEFEIAVHESCHGITTCFDGFGIKYNYFVGNSRVISVPLTDRGESYQGYLNVAVHTDEFAKNIPENMRTFRYDTYVSSSSMVSANLCGVYGMLDEMNAYSLGAATTLKLYPYVKTHGGSSEISSYWRPVYSSLCAYAEFKYWTLGYLLYLKENYPSIYTNILANKDYCEAYTTVTKNYEDVIAKAAANYRECFEEDIFESYGMNDYNLLMNGVLQQKEYQEMDKILTGRETQRPVDETKVKDFVRRMYEIALNRSAEAAGLGDWTNRLVYGGYTGARVAQGFFFSEEMTNRELNDAEFVETLYKVFLDRSSDEAGKAYWLDLMNSGVGREGVFNGFTKSEEFAKICDSYGITPGEITVSEGRDKNYGATQFVSRIYTEALGRNYDIEGLNYWSDKIANKQMTAVQIATGGFFHSPEFLNKNYDDVEYVKVLYRTFMGREYDDPGLLHWLSKMNAGMTRDEVLASFGASQEFQNIMAKYGL